MKMSAYWVLSLSDFRSAAQASVDVLLTLTNFSVVFYLIIVTVQRHHLFIWSVFSPKLLYLSAYGLLSYPMILALQLCVNMRKRWSLSVTAEVSTLHTYRFQSSTGSIILGKGYLFRKVLLFNSYAYWKVNAEKACGTFVLVFVRQ